MKKVKFILLFVTSLFIVLYFSCEDNQEELLFDYRFETQIGLVDKNQEESYVNVPKDLYVKIERNNNKIGDYEINYELTGKGIVKYDGKEIKPLESIKIENNYFAFTFTPTSKGKHKLLFKVINENFDKEIEYELEANQLYFNTTTNNIPEKVLIDKQFAFNFIVEEPIGSKINKFKATAQTVKGKGKLFVVEEDPVEPENSEKADTVKLSNNKTAKAETSIKTSNLKPLSHLKKGNNTLYYIAENKGENVLEFNIENEYGQSEKVDIPLEVKLPSFSLSSRINKEEKYFAGVDLSFVLNVTDTDLHGNNEYNLAYRFLKNTGALKVNNNELQPGAILKLKEGDNICIFNANKPGDSSLEFIVTDKYGTSQKDTVDFSIDNSAITFEITDQETVLILDKETILNISAEKPNYKGAFRFSIIQEPLNSGTIFIGDTEYTGGVLPLQNSRNTLIKFTPDRIGEVKLKFKIFDDYKGEIAKEVVYNVNNSDIDLNITNKNEELVLGIESGFKFTAKKPNYSGNYKYEIIQENNFCNIKINGLTYTQGKLEAKSLNDINVSIEPLQAGEHALTLVIYDDFNGKIEKRLDYSIINPEIIVETTNYSENAIMRKESIFNIAVSKKHYEGNFALSMATEPLHTALIKVNGKVYEGGKVQITDPKNTCICFTALEEKAITLKLNITDEIRGNYTKDFLFKVSNPNMILITSNEEKNLTLDKETKFNFSISKNSYDQGFEYEIIQEPLNSGKIRIGTNDYIGGMQKVINSTNTQIYFTPTKTGDCKLILKLYDEFGGEVSKEIPYVVSNSDIEINVSNGSTDLIIGKPNNIILSVSKPNYSGNYTYDIKQTPDNFCDITIGGKEYISGAIQVESIENINIKMLPKKYNEASIDIIVKDQFGGEKVHRIVYNISNPNIDLNITNYTSASVLQKENIFNASISKEYYSGYFTYSLKQEPLYSGNITVNGKEYKGGIATIADPKNLIVGFTPVKANNAVLTLSVMDQLGTKVDKVLNFNVDNPLMQMFVTNYLKDITLNQPTKFNFSVKKEHYDKGYKFEIIQDPIDIGNIKINGSDYIGGKQDIKDIDNSLVTFIPIKTGNAVLTIKIYNEFDEVVEKQLDFSISNSDIELNVINSTQELVIGKNGGFRFSASKKNYVNDYTYEIIFYALGRN